MERESRLDRTERDRETCSGNWQTGAAGRNGWRRATDHKSQVPGLPTDRRWPSSKSTPVLVTTYLFTGWGTEKWRRSCKRSSTKSILDFRPTAGGWLMPRMSRAATRFTSSLIRGPEANGKFRRKVARNPFGRATENSSTGEEAR